MSFGNPQVVSSAGSSLQPSAPAPAPNTGQPNTSGPFALQNGTPTILTYQVPNDGQKHVLVVAFTKNVTSVETGGSVQANGMINGTTFTPNIFAGGGRRGQHSQRISVHY